MSLKDQLFEDMKNAMKAKEAGKLRLSVIRMARAAIKNAEIDKRQEFEDAQVVEILAREVKMRRDAIIEFTKVDRADQVKKLEEEISVLLTYLPRQLTEEEIRQLTKETIQALGAQSLKDLGKVMGAMTPKTKGRADGKVVNQIVREFLGS
ncbi:MAG: GatB/YqeY domain-containing protein [Peptococcaceae bacterium]|nr:GatB/YqeY domain-containing protein [Peptococcaceae bacterium]